MINAFAMLAGSGGAPRAAIAMGKKDLESARKILGNCFSLLMDGIQDDIAHSAHHRGEHAELGEALRGDERVQTHHDHHEDDSQDMRWGP